MLTIKTLGGLGFQRPDGAGVRLPTRKTAALVAYLAMHPGRRFSRQAITGLLWGDKDEMHARHSLSQAISDIRRTLGGDFLQADPQFIWHDGQGTEIDALRLSAVNPLLAGTLDLEAVEGVYVGDFLEGLELGQEGFDCWVMAERERLRQLAHDQMTTLLEIRMGSDQVGSALGTARKLLTLDPFDESAHRAVLRCYAQTGSTRRAIEHFKMLREQLERELGVDPDDQTLEIYQQLMRGEPIAPSAGVLRDYAAVLEQLPYVVTVTDLSNRIVGWNRIAEDTLGYSKAEMLGRSPTLVFAPNRDLAQADVVLKRALSKGRWDGNVMMTGKDGRTCRQKRVVTPLSNPAGLVIGAFGHGLLISA
jgi:PAS domain S-box-containing protein